MTDIKDLVDAIRGASPDAAVRLRQGVVTAVNTTTVSVAIGGSSTAVSGIKYLNSYNPTVGDAVWMATDGRDWMVLGKLGAYAGGGGGGASVSVSDTAPAGAAAGSLWVRSTDMTAFVRYNDGDSTQWVELKKADNSQLVQRVSTVEQVPVVRLTKSSAQSTSSTANTGTMVSWSADTFASGMWSSGSPTKIYPSRIGKWRVRAKLRFSSTTYCYIQVQMNGVGNSPSEDLRADAASGNPYPAAEDYFVVSNPGTDYFEAWMVSGAASQALITSNCIMTAEWIGY